MNPLFRLALAELAARDRAFELPPELAPLLADETAVRGMLTAAWPLGVVGLVHAAARRWCHAGVVESVLEKTPALRSELHAVMANHGFLSDELKKALACLATERVDTIVLRGPFMAARLYGDTVSRATADIDLLVRPASLEAAGASLTSIGFRARERVDESADIGEYHHLVYEKLFDSGFTCVLDLHVRLITTRFGDYTPETDEIFEHRQLVAEPCEHQCLEPAALFVNLLQQVFKDGGSLKRLIDMEALRLRLRPDPERVVTLARRWGLTRALAYCEAIRERVDVVPPPEPCLPLTSAERSEGRSLLRWYRPVRLFSGHVNSSLRLLMGRRILTGRLGALRYLLWWAIVPPRGVMARRFGLRAGNPCVPLLYLVSPLVSVLYALGLWRRTWDGSRSSGCS